MDQSFFYPFPDPDLSKIPGLVRNAVWFIWTERWKYWLGSDHWEKIRSKDKQKDKTVLSLNISYKKNLYQDLSLKEKLDQILYFSDWSKLEGEDAHQHDHGSGRGAAKAQAARHREAWETAFER